MSYFIENTNSTGALGIGATTRGAEPGPVCAIGMCVGREGRGVCLCVRTSSLMWMLPTSSLPRLMSSSTPAPLHTITITSTSTRPRQGRQRGYVRHAQSSCGFHSQPLARPSWCPNPPTHNYSTLATHPVHARAGHVPPHARVSDTPRERATGPYSGSWGEAAIPGPNAAFTTRAATRGRGATTGMVAACYRWLMRRLPCRTEVGIPTGLSIFRIIVHPL